MNKIKIGRVTNSLTRFDGVTRKRLIEEGKTAFIGRRMGLDETQIFLVTYSCIVLASDPSQTWRDLVELFVDRWVDVEISVVT